MFLGEKENSNPFEIIREFEENTPASRVFLRVFPVFLPPQKLTLPNSNSTNRIPLDELLQLFGVLRV